MNEQEQIELNEIRGRVVERIERFKDSIREHEALLDLIDKYPQSATVVAAMRKLSL